MIYDLVICIRCHEWPGLVLDTLDSVLSFTNQKRVRVICGVDRNNQKLAKAVRPKCNGVVCSGTSWGWGVGLYGLLCESIEYAKSQWQFCHFMSIDYDTLFIGPGADEAALDHITDSAVGLIGEREPRSVRWSKVFETDKGRLLERYPGIPETYTPGEGVQGGCFLMTAALIEEMTKRSYFHSPTRSARSFTKLADDHFVALLCRLCGLQIASWDSRFKIQWKFDGDPFALVDKGVLAFHPTKLRPGKGGPGPERAVREHYQQLRAQYREDA